MAHAGPFCWQFVVMASEHALNRLVRFYRLVRFLLEFSDKCIFGDGASISNTLLFENAGMGNNILDARITSWIEMISLAVEMDRLVYVFNDFVIGEGQQMSTQ